MSERLTLYPPPPRLWTRRISTSSLIEKLYNIYSHERKEVSKGAGGDGGRAEDQSEEPGTGVSLNRTA